MAAEIDGTSKGLLGVFAVCTLGSGIASLAYGIYLLIQYISITVDIGACSIFVTSIILIVIGSLLIITVLLGLFGALKDVSTLRLVTLVLLLLLFVVLVVVGIWAMVSFKTDRLESSVREKIENLNNNAKNMTLEMNRQAKYLNKNLNCCIGYELDTNLMDTQENSCAKTSENTENKAESIITCVKNYYQQKSAVIYCIAILALAVAGGTLIGLLLYGVVSQRARAGYAAVSRG